MSTMHIDRWETISARISHLESKLKISAVDKLAARQMALLNRITTLAQHLNIPVWLLHPGGSHTHHYFPLCSSICTSQVEDSSAQPTNKAPNVSADVSAIQAKLTAELESFNFSSFRFVRAPADYYDQPLEYRQGILNAPSTHHLCKTMIMENTRAHSSVDGWSNPLNSKYYLVIVQYTARLHAEKLKNYIHKLNKGTVGKQFFNMRLAPGDVSDKLSGYEHNAVTPIGIATPLPIILSHQIADLQPPVFWLGAGEVDLKVELPAAEFIAHYKPFVADCTY